MITDKQIEEAADKYSRPLLKMMDDAEASVAYYGFKNGAEWARSQMLSEIIEIAGNAFDAAREMDYIDGGRVFDFVHPDKESYLKTIKDKLK